MKKKSLIIIVGLVLTLIIIAGGIWCWGNGKVVKNNIVQNEIGEEIYINKENNQQNESETESDKPTPPSSEDWRTAKWKIYRDEKNGFEVKYPETFSPDIVDISKRKDYREGDVLLMHKDTLRYINELNYGAAQIDNSVYISVEDNKNNLSLMDWVKENNQKYSWTCNNEFNEKRVRCEKGGITESMAKPITINNNKAMLMSEQSIGDNSIILFLLKNKKIVQFYYKYGGYHMNDGDNFFKKMMESFRIIN